MSFWNLSTGASPDGSESSSHTSSFKVIPDGTMAIGKIKEFVLDKTKDGAPFYKVVYKLIDGDFKNREVIHKIKCFDSKDTIADRALNMLKRLYDLAGLNPSHSEAPTDMDLAYFKGKDIGIKIAEWNMVNADGVLSEGNYISEAHSPVGFECSTGIKNETVGHPVESALSRNSRVSKPAIDNSDIPF